MPRGTPQNVRHARQALQETKKLLLRGLGPRTKLISYRAEDIRKVIAEIDAAEAGFSGAVDG